MTASSPSPSPSSWPEDAHLPLPEQPAGPQIRAVDGNRAALLLLVTQNVVAAVASGVLHLGLGVTLLLAFACTAALAFALFPAQIQALRHDTRWRTPPAWGTALGAFALAFLASRAFSLAYITLVPSAAGSIPQFLSHGPDLIVLLLAAGLLIPFAEEVAFRGMMMRGQERAAGFTVAALATTCAFAIAHGVPASIAGILPLAYVLARVVQHSGSLWNSVLIHALNNSLSVGLGAWTSRHNLPDTDKAMDLIKTDAMRVPMGLGALLFGVAVMVVVHLWLTPKADPQAGSRPGPWFSGAYLLVLLFGVVAILLGIPAVAERINQLHELRGALH